MVNADQSTDLKHRLLDQAIALVEKATGGTPDPQFVEALIQACSTHAIDSFG